MLTLPQNIVCGYYDCREFGDLALSPKRKATKYEIEFYLEDGLSTFADDKEYIIKSHFIQIAKPNQIRYSRLPFKTIYLKFTADGEIAEMLSAAPEYFYCRNFEKVIETLDEIILLNENGNNKILLQSRLLYLLNLIHNNSKNSNLNNPQALETISKAKKYIKSNFMNEITLKDISTAVNLSPIYFHNIFTGVTGISPHDYLINCRICEAKKLLWNSQIPLEMIAENCGFGCQQYFNKIFKKETGTTPGKYRKEIQQNYLEG